MKDSALNKSRIRMHSLLYTCKIDHWHANQWHTAAWLPVRATNEKFVALHALEPLDSLAYQLRLTQITQFTLWSKI